MSKTLLWLEARLGALLLRVFRRLLRWEVHGRNPESQPCIYFFWHRDLLALCMHRIGSKTAVLVSASKDGELLAAPIQRVGYKVVRGSSSRGGFAALKEMLRLSNKYQLGITPDGPRGPAETVHAGVFEIALLGKIPIIAVAVRTRREWRLNSWDSFRIPKPFTRVTVNYSQPLFLTDKQDIPQIESQIRQFIKDHQN